jgi:hypothetical protein
VKKAITGPVATAIIVVVSIVVLGFLYTQFLQDKKISPEETRSHMGGAASH